MKYLKYFEKNIQFACSIDIRNIGTRKVHIICEKLIEWFADSGYRFQSKLIDVADIDPKYLKLNTKDYNFIEVSRTYTSLEEDHDPNCDHIIDPEIVLMSETAEEFIQNVETYEKTEKFNI